MKFFQEILSQWFATRSRRSRFRSQTNIAAAVQQLELRALLTIVPPQFVDPHPEQGNNFGGSVTVLTNGNVVISASNDDAGGGSVASYNGAGAVYLYNGRTGSLISTLTGSQAGDQIGAFNMSVNGGVFALANGNFVVDSPAWNGGVGAVTWGNGTTGVSGSISAANSLVGSSSTDGVGSGQITVLSNGNYVVDSYTWNTNFGAVTWGSGTTGVKGIVSAANSLVGSAQTDQVGGNGVSAVDSITVLSNGNYVVASPDWNLNLGAVTWGSGTTGVKGVVGAANSLVGSTENDVVGSNGVKVLSNGNYVVISADWSNGLNIRAGAVTFGNGTSGTAGAVSPTNSLVGSSANDGVGIQGVTALTNGNYVVDSPNWSFSRVPSVGAVTFGNGTTGVMGIISPTNSLIGSAPSDQVGSYSVTALANGNYVVDSYTWNNNRGAVTWGNGQTGLTGTIVATNSLMGSQAGDKVGSEGVTPLLNGNYVVASPNWSTAAVTAVGAVTWGDGSIGLSGTITATNSLLGSTANDEVGFNGVTALSNGNYVVMSSVWNNQFGAVTWGSGLTGVIGTVVATNSLVGSQSGDSLGERGVTALRNGNYVVASPSWSNGSITTKVGAVTWGSGTTGVSGTVTQTNSLVGSNTNDQVGNGSIPITVLSNGNYVVSSPNWSNISAPNAGAVTWGDGTTGVSGAVDVTNSLVGVNSSDQVGSGTVTALNNGNYVVPDSAFSNNLGSVTFGNGATGVSGVVSNANSILGQIQFSFVYVVPDNAHGAIYAAFSSGTTSSSVYRGSTATGFLSQTTNGPSINVSNYSTAVTNGTGSVGFDTVTLDPSVSQTIATQLITVTNSGDDPLIVQPVTATGGFTIVNNFTVNQSILPGASASFTVQLNATTAGSPTGTVTILSNDATANHSFKFNVTGTVAVPVIAVQDGATTLESGGDTVSGGTAVGQGGTVVGMTGTTVSTVSFGTTLVGIPVSKAITVTNHGHAPLFVTSVTVPTGFSVTNDLVTNRTIAPGGSARFTLQLNANAVATFVGASNSVTIVNNDPHSTQLTFNVTGTVTAPIAVVQQGVTTLTNGVSTINLGSTPVNTPVTRVITVTNSGNSPLFVQPVIVPTGFAIAGANFHAGQSIPVGGNASFTLQLTATAAGNFADIVTIPTSDTLARQFSFSVTGIVTPVAGVGSPSGVMVVQQGTTFLANGRSQDYFAVGSRVAQVITVSNHGNAALVMGAVTVPAGFTLSNDRTSNQSIAAGASASFMIQLNPGVTNTPVGNVTIPYHDPISKTFTFSVVADHAPTAIRLSSSSVSINPTGPTFVGVLTTADPDSSIVPQIFTYLIGRTSLNFVPTNPSFSIDSGGDLYLTPMTLPAVVGLYDVSITSTDQGGSSVNPPQTIRVYVGGPSVTGVESSLDTTLTSGIPKGSTLLTFLNNLNQDQEIDGQSGGQQTMAFGAAVPGSSSDLPNPITYQLGVGGDNSDFTIDQNGHLQTAVTLNAAVKPIEHISIISTNTLTGISATHPFTVTVLAAPTRSVVVTPPTAPLTVPEASANGFVVGTVSATDVGGQNLTYAISGGNTNGAFAINSVTGQITVANSAALDLASSPSFVLTVKASDTGISSSATITINLTGVTLSNRIVADNAAVGTVIGQFNTTAAQSGNTFQYSLIQGKDNDAYFAIDASGHLRVNLALNVPMKNSYTIDVISIDQNGLAITKTFTITILRLSGEPSQIVDPHPELGNQFGTALTALSNGNVVITSPNDDAGGGNAAAGTGAGAVYLFSGQTGLLISSFKGSQAGDHLGSDGVTALTNGNFVIDSANWHNGLGAVTWGSGTAIVNVTIGSINSLVGSIASDAVGLAGVTALPTGNYVADSPSWNHVAVKVGAVTFGNGTTGIVGSVSSSNSLVGTLANDQVGLGGVTVLSSGNYVVDSSAWNQGTIAAVGAVTWVSGTTGVAGTISATNSLIGSTANDAVGLGGVTALSNGNYVVDSPSWNHGAAKVGAVTFGIATGISGVVAATNSLVGTSENDQVGLGGVTTLGNGNYVVASYSWNGGVIGMVGAVTWGSGSTGVSGAVSQTNSLVGTQSNDRVGSGGVTALSNGNYVVDSYTWNNGAVASAGAVTLGNGTTGMTGTILPTNSLVGSKTDDYVGRSGVAALTNGNYVVASKYWHNGSFANAGAATWGNGLLGVVGVVSPTNSLVGSSANDNVGIGGVTALTNGNYVVDSYLWNGLSAAIAGAATWGSGTTGVTGAISSSNSLVGTQANDYVGLAGVTALSNGNYVVASKYWNNGVTGAATAGAVTWGNGTVGVKGNITQTNSLVGSRPGDFVGFGGSGINSITALSNGNYLVNSNNWNNGAVIQVGAVTFGNGRTGVVGVINNQNSVVGQFSTPLHSVDFVRVTPDDIHGAVYAEMRPSTGLSQVYRGSTATGFSNRTTSGPSINVSNEIGAITSGTGTFNFGTVTVGTPVTQTIRITNNGNAPLVVQPVTVTAGYSIVAGTNFTLNQAIAPGATASFTLQLNATATGMVHGIVAIENNVSPFTFNVTGVVGNPLVVVKQGATTLVNGSSAIDLGTAHVGTPVSKIITVTNNGTTPLFVSAITVPSGFSVINDFVTNQSIASGASANFTLQLNATSPDTLSGTVTIVSNAANLSAFQFHVTGSVTAPSILVQQGATTLSSLGSPINFGTTTVGTPVTQVITVTNNGNSALIVQPVTGPAGFSVVAGQFTANQTIAVGASVSFTLRLNAVTSANPTGFVIITSNDLSTPAFVINVTGIVTSAATPVMVVKQGSSTLANGVSAIVFNNVTAGTAASQVVTITNGGTAPLVVTSVTVTAGFSVINNNAVTQPIAIGGSATFTVQLNANATGTPSGQLTINSNDPSAHAFALLLGVNHRPSAVTLAFTGNAGSVVTMNQTSAVPVGVLTTTDPDSSSGPTFIYTVTSPTFLNVTVAIPAFSVDRLGHLYLSAGAPVGAYNLSVTSTDDNGLSVTQNLPPIYVTGPGHPAVAVAVNVANNTPAHSSIANLPVPSVVVQDAGGIAASTNQVFNLTTYRLGVGGDNSSFTIVANGHLQTAVKLDASVKASYQITIFSTDTTTGLSTARPYSIKVVPVLKNTIVVTPATLTLPMASANGAAVGTVAATDTGGQAPKFAIIGGNIGGAFAINATTGAITVANTTALQVAFNPSFKLTVQVIDNGVGASGSATITINLTGITLSSNTVAENAMTGTIIGQFNTKAAVPGNTFQYSLVANKDNDSGFTIDATGHLKLNGGLNIAVKNSYTIDVVSTDQNQHSTTQVFTILVLGPSNMTLSSNSVAGTAVVGTVIGQFSTADNGTGNTFTYKLPTATPDNAAFTVDTNGNLKLNTTLNVAVKKAYQISVISTDQRGLAISKAFTINVT